MKPTNEERREVAERLRNMTCRDCRYAEQFYELLKETVMNVWDFHEFDDVADRLAGLIEPEPERTCRDEGTSAFRCGRCGAFALRDAITDLCGPIPIRYCPNCGAKVVDE